MASIVRPSLVRQACLYVPSKRVLSNKASITPISAFKAPSTSPAQSLLSRQTPVKKPLVRDALQGPLKVAAFHVTARQAIIPPGPQILEGTANDAAPIPPTSPTHGSYHWTFERLIAVSLIPLTVAPFAAGSLNPITDAALCGAMLIHSHVGFQSIIIDYIPSKRLPKTRSLFIWGLRGATLLVGVGLYEFETNDVGLTEAIRRIWTA
ncbi:MAG: membrane anchor subunit of succinate dehydrogenase, Sdh4 [Pleopsidium flavum]|nr:MAG: membrane anchor subunit of succinate dehydrogenase, Sdh4 [Pleopsidium flavum]